VTDAGYDAAGPGPVPARRLYVYTGGFLYPGRVRRILTLAGYRITTGLPGPGDLVGVWGRSPRAHRGEAVAARRGAALLRVEDAFLRSVHPGRRGAPIGLLADRRGVHFDPATPSDLEHLLATAPLDDTALLDRARLGMARMAALDLSKYNSHDPALPAPAPGYVLVIDQVAGDASLRHGGVPPGVFRDMLVTARADHPGARIVIKAHPAGAGCLGPDDLAALGGGQGGGGVVRLTDPVSPRRLFDGAVAVYTVSSQLGFEAVLAGHRPRVFGQPFYAGWGLTDDVSPPPRRHRRLTRPQLFAAAMILAPLWYDPCRDRLCSFEVALDQMEAEVRAFRQDRHGHVATGVRLWKRASLQRHFGREKPLIFVNDPARAAQRAVALNRPLLIWAGHEGAAATAPHILRVEDGFLRSRGLGAALVPPLSLVTDDLGIYYDPGRESRLERLIAAGPPPGGERRAEALMARLRAAGLSKYNLGGALPALPNRADAERNAQRILVPGQVEDDASIRLGAGAVRSNLGLLERTRAENPDALILYKPHPDVEAGLRPGVLTDAAILRFADAVVPGTDAALLIDAVDAVWTMTSTLGFEALLRGRPVTCLGAPFYAGWGLTRDLGPVPARRNARRNARLNASLNAPPTLAALVHAVLIAYPRYLDPVTGLACPPEVVADRLATGTIARPGPVLRLLSKAQGAMAGHAHWWR
jgi:capsular polysaccharide export protein